MKKIILTSVLALVTFFSVNAQELYVIDTSSISIDELPEYIVVTSENTRLLGGININIDAKKSVYQDQLEELESLLQDRRKLKIRNQTDLLNAMSQLGYDYKDAFNATAGTLGASGGDDVELFGSEAKYRINMVFRKKEEYRD